jgi:hypothetical protein
MIITEKGINFKSLEEEIYKYVCSEGLKLLEYVLSQVDGKLLLNRNGEKYRNKGFRTSSIKTLTSLPAGRWVIWSILVGCI